MGSTICHRHLFAATHSAPFRSNELITFENDENQLNCVHISQRIESYLHCFHCFQKYSFSRCNKRMRKTRLFDNQFFFSTLCCHSKAPRYARVWSHCDIIHCGKLFHKPQCGAAAIRLQCSATRFKSTRNIWPSVRCIAFNGTDP